MYADSCSSPAPYYTAYIPVTPLFFMDISILVCIIYSNKTTKRSRFGKHSIVQLSPSELSSQLALTLAFSPN